MKKALYSLIVVLVGLPLLAFTNSATPNLSVNNFVAGDFAVFEVIDATPHSPVMFAMSFRGAGPTSTADYGVVNLSKPIYMMPTIVSDAFGVAKNERRIPRGFIGSTMWFLSYDVASETFSNTV